MKFNKLIAKGLALGIILNSTSILSYANTEIPNRYQTLEGEHITIDDSMEGNLEEIEIFGNTVQDLNNLEDIQSVGDLYVDESGNPILDSQGMEQYKINFISNNGNLFDEKWVEHPNISYKIQSKNYIKVDDNLTYITNNMNIWYSELGYRSLIAQCYDENFTYLGHVLIYASGYRPFTLIKGTKYIKFDLDGDMDNLDKIYCQLNIGTKLNQYTPYQQKKIEVLLPTQLQKVGDVADRLYWDNNKRKYVIEKNIGNITLTGNETWYTGHWDGQIEHIGFEIKDLDNKIGLGYNSHFKQGRLVYDGEIECFDLPINGFLSIKIRRDRLVTEDIEGFKVWLSNNNVKVYYPLLNTQIIETNITQPIKIPTYDEKTYIYIDSKNNINPTLKVTIDRLPQIAKEAVAQAESDNTNHNISLARRYINMLPESSYKDELQIQLSDIFSSDMVLDRKTATSNLDVYIKSENILQMSLDTNQINFDDFSGIEDEVKENAVNIAINSSLPYQINAYLPAEIQNANKTKTLDKSILNIKESSSDDYQTFTNTTDKIILKDNCSAGNQLTHGVDLKLAGGIAHEKDVYKATIKLEAEQK